MNKIYKVMYSKVKQCCVVVSEIAKSHGRHTKRSVAKSSAALTAGVLIALGSFSFEGMPVVQAADGTESLRNNDFVGANDYYWYYDEKEKDKDKKWKTYQYKATDIFNNRSRHDLPNYQGGGAKLPGAITAGLYAQAGQQTVTIGDRNAGQSKGSVFIGEHSGYNNGDNAPAGMKNNYVTSVGFQSDATGWGSIAIGSNATAENSKMESQVVEEVGDAHTSGTVSDDTYGIKEKPAIQGASVALGYSAKAKDGNIAIGAYSDAMDTSSATPYVSVGNGTLKRRITNVANGTDNSDVVTVGQMNDAIKQADNLNVNAGWGINVADENDPTNTGKGTKNVISLKHNLGTGYNDDEAKGMIIGGLVEDRDPAKQYGAADANSVIVGAGKALASGKSSVVVGGLDNVASGATSVVIGGDNNNAAGNQSAVFGGRDNKAAGVASTASGGIMNNAAVGQQATAIGGSQNYVLGANATAVGGLGRDYANGEVVYDSAVRGGSSVGIAGGSTGENAIGALAAGHQAVVTTENGTAIGYQATTDEANTIAFGHDAGDVSGYTIKWKQLPPNQINADGTTNDYTQAPESVTENKYTTAAYNRLVKVADGQDDHDVVVMEQLKQYAEKDASNLGNNIKVYKTDEKGNVQLGKDKQPVEDKDATTTAQKNSKDAWGKALGAGTFTTGKSDAATDASNSEQLVTGKTLYNYDAPVAETGKKLNYVSANNTTGQNLSALDAQVADNASKLNDKTHNIKYYSVNDKKSSTQETLPTVKGLLADNSDNKGAKGMGSLASGFSTEADGIASTVAGSYSGVINTGDVKLMGYDFRGATALSYGTFNINQSTAQSGVFSGVANSIVGQANMTTNSNAAIIYGAGNTVTNSYRLIDPTKAGAILDNVSDPAKLGEALQAAVKDSGGQVMVMGGGNTVDKAYMTQVTGVGNTVTGADSTYAEGTSTQYNFVDGFQNELTNGKNDYIIGSNNSVTGDHIDKNQSNIVVGDNHTLTNRKNNVVIGSADKKENKNKELTASDATVIGHNADVTVDGGVAIGSGSVSKATAEADAEGYDPVSTTTNKASTNTSATWKATTGAVSIGGVNGNTTTTRRITNLAAGFNDTDAVNVAQIKKLASVDASNIGKNFKDGDVTTNENAWGEALGTGTVTKDNKQLVTGGTVYNEVRPSRDGKYVKMSQTTGDNLLKLDDQVKTNTDKLSDVDSRSVKYDTKTENGKTVVDENGKTVVDNTKITLAGEGGTTITNLKDGVKNSDAATVGQLNSKIAGVTYTAGNGIAMDSTAKTISAKAGNGITVDTNGINAKAGTGITVNANGINVNTGKHLSVNTDGQIDVGDNGTVAEHDGNLVTGDTVYKALNGGMTKMIIGTPGKDGKDGKDGTPGTIGLVGPAGTNGKDGAVDITIQKGEDGKDGTKGANGVDGKNGINRIVYEDKNGKHQVATMEDGLKFAGDDGQNDATKAIAKKLNNTVDIIGGADSTKLTANNIGVNNVDGKLKIQLAKNLAGITSIANQTTTGKGDAQTTTGAKIDLKDDGSISVNSGKITDVKSGLTATDGTYADTDKNNAANIGDVHSMIEKEAGNTDDKLALKANVAADNIGTHITDTTAQKTNLDNWGEAIGTGKIADPDASDKETNGSKQLVTGGTVYNEVRPSKDGKYVKIAQTTGANLIALDDQVKQNAQNISDNTYAQGDGILMDKTKKTISVNKGDGLKFYEGKLAVDAGNGLKIDNGAVAIKTSDSNLKVDSNGIGLSDKITIGSDKTKQVTIDGTNGEISGLTNTTWDSKADYSKSTKAATESQVDAAVKDAVKQAGENDIHVAAGSYAVNDQNQVSMNLVDKNNDTKGTVIITDVAKSSEMGDVSKLADGVKNAGGKTTTVVDAINNVNENVNSVDRKVGDLNYFEQNDGKTHTVTNGTSITKAIGDLDSAVQNATEQAGKHTIVSTKDTNLDVKNIAKDGEAANYQIALNQDLNVNTVTAKTVTTDNLTVNKSATIGGVTIANKTISGLDDTKIEKGSTNAVNAGTIWNELRPSGGTYINQNNTTAQNLTSLDTQVKKTSDLINSDGKTIKIGGSDAATKIDVNGKDGKGRVITGVVSDANDPTSAANVGYVNGVTAANTQQIYRDMNNAYGRLNNNINKAAAGSNALAALHPLDYDPDDKADFAVGYGHYRNANAAAVGAFYHPNENTMVNVGVSLGNGDPGFNAGVSFKVGRGGAGREAMSKTEMAKVINSQSKEIDALKKDNADKDKRIDALEQKMAEILAKLDKNGK